MLRTIAVGAETPELLPSVIPIPAPNASVQNLVNDISQALGVPPPAVTVANEATIRNEIREEFFVTRFGRRDALWSLRRSLGQARELVLIVSPQLARTARPAGAPAAHEIDLVAVLADSMTANPALHVMVALPLWPDADAAYGGWVREAFAARKEASTR